MKFVTDNTFSSEVLASKLPVLVKFTASWCGPCKAISPVLDKLEKEYVDKVSFVSVDLDDSPETPVKYKIKGVPSLLMFKEGKVVGSLVGAAPEKNIRSFIEANV